MADGALELTPITNIKFCNKLFVKSSLNSIDQEAKPTAADFQAEAENEYKPCGVLHLAHPTMQVKQPPSHSRINPD
ncbi:MAG: hypothetical protein ACBR18_16900 [Microcoleus sp.]